MQHTIRVPLPIAWLAVRSVAVWQVCVRDLGNKKAGDTKPFQESAALLYLHVKHRALASQSHFL